MRSRWFIAAVVVALAAIVIAVVASKLKGSDGSGKVEASAWASSVCSSLAEWRSSITSLASTSGGTLTKESLRQKLDTAQAATQTLVSSLQDLGPPNLESGDQLQQELESQATSLQSSFQSLQERASQTALSASSPAAFLEGLAGLGGDYQKLLTQIGTVTGDLANAAGASRAELQQSFADADSCKQLRASG